MEYRIDRKSNNELSILGLGCMRFPRGINTRIDVNKSEKLILYAIEKGINYFDTAYIYGGSEEALGEILYKNNLRGKVFIATKLPHHKCRNYEDFELLFQTQLKRLKTNYFDYYLIHNLPDTDSWKRICNLGIEKWIAKKKENGQIRQIGFSFHGSQNEFFELLEAYPWEFCQIQYNYMNENYQAGRAGLQKANEKGLPVIVMVPLLGGKLANGLPKKAVKLFKNADRNLSEASWAFRWLWNQPEVTVALSGMNSIDQLSDNIKTAENAVPHMLTEKESAIFSSVREIFKESYKVLCTGCNYCMPCPCGVNIPAIFAAYNVSYVAGFVSGMQQYVTSIGTDYKNNRSGRNCIKCGKCEKQCPQNIKIISCLETVTKRMEPFWFRTALRIVERIMR